MSSFLISGKSFTIAALGFVKHAREASHSLQAEFKGGALIVNGTVALRREQSQGAAPSIHVEGPLSEDYYKVRELLYSQYHIL